MTWSVNGQWGPEGLLDSAGNAQVGATIVAPSGYAGTVDTAGNGTVVGPPADSVTITVTPVGAPAYTKTVQIYASVSETDTRITAAASGALTQTTVQTAPFTAAPNQDIPVDTTGGGFTGTLPAAVVGVKDRFVNVGTGTTPFTLAPAGTDTYVLPSSALPVTAVPGESLYVRCYVTGRWSLI